MKINKIFQVVLLLLILLSVPQGTVGQEYDVDRSYTTRSEVWTSVTYSDFIYPDYPEYYPVEIEFRSLGKLPQDLQELTNYSGPVFIGHYIISSNLSTFDTVDRERDTDELIGERAQSLKFKVNVSQDITAILFEIRFAPHNESLGLGWDIYDLLVETKQEATVEDLSKAFMIFVSPLLFVGCYYSLHRYLNRRFLDNVKSLQVPRYFGKLIIRNFGKLIKVNWKGALFMLLTFGLLSGVIVGVWMLLL